MAAARIAGEKAWQMPMDEEYKDYLKSAFADLPNIGGRHGGSITAAWFLREFADPTPWVHLDIAATAWLDDGKAGSPRGLPASPCAPLSNWRSIGRIQPRALFFTLSNLLRYTILLVHGGQDATASPGICSGRRKGTRLYPLTKERAKPAVPFGGRYRIIDFVLSNLVNSGIYSIYVLIQFKSQSSAAAPARRMGSQRSAAQPLHHSGAGADAFRAGGLVSRHRRRDLPEHQSDRAGRPARGGHFRRRPHLPHEHPRDDGVSRAKARAA